MYMYVVDEWLYSVFKGLRIVAFVFGAHCHGSVWLLLAQHMQVCYGVENGLEVMMVDCLTTSPTFLLSIVRPCYISSARRLHLSQRLC